MSGSDSMVTLRVKVTNGQALVKNILISLTDGLLFAKVDRISMGLSIIQGWHLNMNFTEASSGLKFMKVRSAGV